jgi:hypothetical protein
VRSEKRAGEFGYVQTPYEGFFPPNPLQQKRIGRKSNRAKRDNTATTRPPIPKREIESIYFE